jgi:hypothetical protein
MHRVCRQRLTIDFGRSVYVNLKSLVFPLPVLVHHIMRFTIATSPESDNYDNDFITLGIRFMSITYMCGCGAQFGSTSTPCPQTGTGTGTRIDS